jgi:hypothetical protein
MNQECIFFSIFGQVWTDKAKDEPRKEADIIRVRNLRNGLSDSDIVGEGQGNCKEAGWYSLTIADLAGQKAVVVGDVLEFGLYGFKDTSKKIYDFGNRVITVDDVARGGIMINFDLARR